MTRRGNKSRSADLEAQSSDEGVHSDLSYSLRSPFIAKMLSREMRMK
jgi:hypothetical protein